MVPDDCADHFKIFLQISSIVILQLYAEKCIICRKIPWKNEYNVLIYIPGMGGRFKNMKKYRINKKVVARNMAILFIILIVTGAVLVYFNIDRIPGPWDPWVKASKALEDQRGYDIIGENENEDYAGTGQERVMGNNQYFTTFTTTDGKVYREYKQAGITPWADEEYWYDTVGVCGCGITALSVALSGMGLEETPGTLRQRYPEGMDYDNMEAELRDVFGIESSGFFYDEVSLSKERLKQHLDTGNPIIICVWEDAGENRWTTLSHYMVMLAKDHNDKVYISNPSGLVNEANSSGWYDFDEVVPYIAKVLFIGSED